MTHASLPSTTTRLPFDTQAERGTKIEGAVLDARAVEAAGLDRLNRRIRGDVRVGVGSAEELAIEEDADSVRVGRADERGEMEEIFAFALEDGAVAEEVLVGVKEGFSFGDADLDAVGDKAEVGAVDLLGDDPIDTGDSAVGGLVVAEKAVEVLGDLFVGGERPGSWHLVVSC